MMKNGDFLNPHIDNSHNSSRNKYRRLNLLFYVTPNWQESNGGNFELWNKKVTKPITVTSKFNRMVVMETTNYSYHSVSPIKVNAYRCCVSNYYFSVSPPEWGLLPYNLIHWQTKSVFTKSIWNTRQFFKKPILKGYWDIKGENPF